MSFTPVDRDDLECRECSAPVTLKEYRRWGLCEWCELERKPAPVPDALPEAWTA